MGTLIRRAIVEYTSRFVLATLFLFAILAFLPVLSNDFIDWGDQKNLLQNLDYRGFGWTHLAWMFTTTHGGYYQPFTWLTFALDYHLWNLDPFGYHLTSLLLHGATTALLFAVTLKLLAHIDVGESRLEPSVSRWIAAGAVLFFAVHPMRVEAVAWASARNLLLSAVFLLLAVFSYLRAAECSGGRTNNWLWMSVAITAHLLSVFSGANGFMLPILLFLIDVYPLKRLESYGVGLWLGLCRTLPTKLPFVLSALLGMSIIMRLRTDLSAAIDVPRTTSSKWLAQVAYEPIFYLWKSAVPNRLLPGYELPEVISEWMWALFFAGFVLITAGVAVLSIRTRHISPAVAWLCYLTIVFMTPIQNRDSGLQGIADRYAYLPSFVVAVVVAVAVQSVAQSQWISAFRLKTFGLGSGILFVAVLLGILTWRQSSVWHDAERLWKHAVVSDPRSRQARQRLANVLTAQNKDQEAFQLYKQAAAENVNSALAQADVAQALVSRGQLDEAATFYRRALEIAPSSPEGLFGMGNVLTLQGDLDGAIAQYRRILEITPSASFVHVNLGYALARRGQIGEATNHYRKAIELDASNVNAHFNLASILGSQGDINEAVRHYRTTVKIAPNHSKAHYGLANLLLKIGNRKEALAEYQEAIKFDPDYPDPYQRLGNMFAEQNQLDKAIAYYRHALGIRPNFTDARLGLARALAAQGKKQEALREYEEARRLLQTRGDPILPN